MKTEEFNAFFKEKQKKNPDTLYLTQLSIANYYCDKEQMEFLSQNSSVVINILSIFLEQLFTANTVYIPHAVITTDSVNAIWGKQSAKP